MIQPAVTPSRHPSRDEIRVFHGDDDAGLRQPSTFQCCPLGIQLYNRSALPLYELVEFTLELPGEDENAFAPVSCVGIVAHCERDDRSGLFRIWVKFLDLPEDVKRQLQCLTQAMDHLCPFCANF